MSPRYALTAWAFIFAFLVAAVTAQTPAKDAGQEKSKPLREAIDGLDKSVKDKSDVDIIHFVTEIGTKFALGDKAMQDEAVDKLVKQLKSKSKDVRTNVLEALSKTTARATAGLVADLDSDMAKDNVSYLCKVIAALGALKDEKALPVLSKLMHHKDLDACAQAVAALANYKDAKLDQRKALFEDILKNYGPVESAATKSGAKTTDKAKFDKLQSPFESTLAAITNKQGLKGTLQWDQWYRKEGKKLEQW